MKIVVAIKQVAGRDSQLRIASSGQWVEEAGLAYEINEPDAYALEEALQLKEKHGGEVVTLCAGPARAAQAIRETLAKGADRAIHIEEDNISALDPLAVARLLAAAIAAESPALVLTGLQSDDLGHGQTGVILAELLGLPHATIVMEVEKLDGAIRVKRELEGGWYQYVEMPLPALVTIQSGIHKLRYATLMGIKKARMKEIRTVAASSLGGPGGRPAGDAGVAIDRVYFPERSTRTQLIEGDARAAAAKLVEKLRFEARVI
jgi:electron transfer flavoprotein beta subunit